MFAKLTAYLFAVLICYQGSGIDYSDILKLDELIEHAAFHKKEYGDNLITFLTKHYGEQKEAHHKEHQEEQDDHSELPFQNQQLQYTVSQAFLIQLVRFDRNMKTVTGTSDKSTVFFYAVGEYDSPCLGIFQPPRYA